MIFDLEELFKYYKNQRIYLLRMQGFQLKNHMIRRAA